MISPLLRLAQPAGAVLAVGIVALGVGVTLGVRQIAPADVVRAALTALVLAVALFVAALSVAALYGWRYVQQRRVPAAADDADAHDRRALAQHELAHALMRLAAKACLLALMVLLYLVRSGNGVAYTERNRTLITSLARNRGVALWLLVHPLALLALLLAAMALLTLGEVLDLLWTWEFTRRGRGSS